MPHIKVKRLGLSTGEEEVIAEHFIPDEEWDAMSHEEWDKQSWELLRDHLSASAWIELEVV